MRYGFFHQAFKVAISCSKSIFSLILAHASILLSRRTAEPEFSDVMIALLKPLGVGDVIMLLPFLAALPKRFPGASVYIISDYEKIANVDGIQWITISEAKKIPRGRALLISPDVSFQVIKLFATARYKLGYFGSTQPYTNFLGKLPKCDIVGQHYGHRVRNLLEPLRLSDNEFGYRNIEILGDRSMRWTPNNDYVVVAPISNWASRQYSIERYVGIIRALSIKIQVVLVGTADEALVWTRYWNEEVTSDGELFKVLNLMGKTSFREMVGLFQGATLCIANDSGPAHVGSVSSANTIIVYGCCSGESRKPLFSPASDRVSLFSNGEACPHFPCYSGFGEPVCKNPEKFICLDVDPNSILTEAIKVCEFPVEYN